MRSLVRVVAAVVLVAVLSPSVTDSSRTLSGLRACEIPGITRPTRCGLFEVPEAPDDPGSRSLFIRVVVVSAAAAKALPDPVLFLAGGPGQGAAELAAALTQRLAFLNDTRDLVLIDQRGTGRSSPLTCPPPSRTSDLTGRIFDSLHLATCRNELAKRADLRRYTTSAAAADYERVLAAIGYRDVNVWGVSYGSRLALELVRRMPQRVRTLTIEAAVPTSFAWPTFGARDFNDALNAVIADCEAEDRCAENYATFRADVDAAFSRLAREPIALSVVDPARGASARVRFSAPDMAYATRGLLYGGDAWHLPQLFRDAGAGDYSGFAQAYVNRARTLARELATGVHLGVYCAEDVPFVDRSNARKLATGTRIGEYLLNEYVRACDGWPRGTIPADFREPVRSAVPSLIMTGRRDPVTPSWTADEVAKTLPRSRVIKWHYGGHGYDGLASPGCKQRMIRDFITSTDPMRVATDCASTEPPARFAQ